MKSEQLRNRILAADLVWIPVALFAEQRFCSDLHWNQIALAPFNFVVYVVCTVFAWVLLSENLHLDGFRGGWRLSAVVSQLLLAVALLSVLLLAIDNVSGRPVGRLTVSVFALLLFLGFLAVRWGALRLVLRRYRNGELNRVVIVGSDSVATELAMKFHDHPEHMSKVVGFLCPRAELAVPQRESAPPRTVSTMQVTNLLREHNVHELVLACTPASHEILSLVALCRERQIRVSLVPQPYELYLSRPRLFDLGGLPLLQLGEMAQPASARISKRILDLGLGLVLAVGALPVVLICALALRLSTGRAFRWETRIGRRGEEFSMLRLNVERKVRKNSGRSGFEWLLWQLSLSELPQLWNVLCGQMSLVGPRPESRERTNRYSAWQKQRLTVKPGMTGLAQVQGLREQHSSEDKTRQDLQYMLRPSCLKDLSLLIETIWTVMLRLIRMPEFWPGSRADKRVDGASQPIANFSNLLHSVHSQTGLEVYPHAHRTQSGSD